MPESGARSVGTHMYACMRARVSCTYANRICVGLPGVARAFVNRHVRTAGPVILIISQLVASSVTEPRVVLVQNQHTREIISARNT